MTGTASGPYVEVSAGSSPALSEPHFLIKLGEAYYLSLALWKYDPSAVDMTPEQQAGLALVQRLFEEAQTRDPLSAIKVQFEDVLSGGRTSPPPRNPTAVVGNIANE